MQPQVPPPLDATGTVGGANLLSTLIALVDTGVELNGPHRQYYDMADAYNSQTNQFVAVSGEAVVQDTHGHGRVLTNQTMVGVLEAKNQAARPVRT